MTSSTYSAAREEPAAGFGAEVQVRRQLTGRWGFGAGLGYQVYATAQTVTATTIWRRTNYAQNIQPDSIAVSTTRPRDTYRFLTVPLRLSYQLGTGNPRWRYGLLAGAEVAIYLGGTTTEGGSRKQWGSSDSPYRSLNLALSLGAEVRYRLAPRWELLAQPTTTIFLNSLARPASGYVVRYPVAANGLVGVAYGLR